MNFRIAKPSDAAALADVHIECAAFQTDGFMHKLGKPFLTQYYKIFTAEKNSLIIIAEDEKNYALGFHSGTKLAEEHLKALSDHKFRLALSVLPSLFKNKNIYYEIFRRFSSIRSNGSNDLQYGVKSGPRGEYWAWRPSNKNSTAALLLHKIWYNTIRELGVTHIKSEVDMSNSRIVKSVKLMGAEFLSEIELPDGRRRAIVQYKL
jgi:hypothetical protein